MEVEFRGVEGDEGGDFGAAAGLHDGELCAAGGGGVSFGFEFDEVGLYVDSHARA